MTEPLTTPEARRWYSLLLGLNTSIRAIAKHGREHGYPAAFTGDLLHLLTSLDVSVRISLDRLGKLAGHTPTLCNHRDFAAYHHDEPNNETPTNPSPHWVGLDQSNRRGEVKK